MNRDTATVECSSCHGSGRVPIPDHFQEIMKILSNRKAATVEAIHKKIKDEVTQNAVANRLMDMKHAGLVTRVRKGKVFYYSLS